MVCDFRRLRIGAAAFALAAGALPLAARGQTAESGPPFTAIIWVDIDSPPGLMREVQPIGDWQDWIRPADFDAEAFAGKPLYSGFAFASALMEKSSIARRAVALRPMRRALATCCSSTRNSSMRYQLMERRRRDNRS